jgi:hypothetical protein
MLGNCIRRWTWSTLMRLGRLIVATAAAMLSFAAPAFAALATTTTGVTVYAGPGSQYQAVGSIGAYKTVEVGHCSDGWCQVSGDDFSGWVARQYLDTDEIDTPAPQPQPSPLPQPQPQPQPWPMPTPTFPWPQPQPQPWPQPQPLPHPLPPVYEEAGACFYSERNYGGLSICLDDGESYSRLRSWDNRIRSVEVFGGAHVDICADRNFNGACATITSNVRRLPTQLDRKVSSLEVY